VGDVLPIESHHANCVHLRFAKISKFIGRLGTRGGSWAVELTSPVKS
jgi:flagellar motor switch protein FliM